MNSNIYKGWVYYILLLLGDILIDASIRLSNGGNFRSSIGLPEEVWFLVHFLAIGTLFYYLLCEIRQSGKGYFFKVGFIVAGVVFAAAIYIAAIYGYVLGTGIDSF